jgi:hypothetical protein
MKRPSSFDVFLSASQLDRGIADVVRRAFEARGLTVFTPADCSDSTGLIFADTIHSAMADCRAFVVILSRASMNSAWTGVELGAALAWGKSIHVLLEGILPEEVTPVFAQHPLHPMARLRVVVEQVERSITRLTPDQAQTLRDLYLDMGVTTDRLSSDPTALNRLSRRFNRAAATNYSPERILQELIRLRKSGRLPRLKRVKPS